MPSTRFSTAKIPQSFDLSVHFSGWDILGICELAETKGRVNRGFLQTISTKEAICGDMVYGKQRSRRCRKNRAEITWHDIVVCQEELHSQAVIVIDTLSEDVYYCYYI
jgi:hypothetical protein